jgi:hypothetical protein
MVRRGWRCQRAGRRRQHQQEKHEMGGPHGHASRIDIRAQIHGLVSLDKKDESFSGTILRWFA